MPFLFVRRNISFICKVLISASHSNKPRAHAATSLFLLKCCPQVKIILKKTLCKGWGYIIYPDLIIGKDLKHVTDVFSIVYRYISENLSELFLTWNQASEDVKFSDMIYSGPGAWAYCFLLLNEPLLSLVRGHKLCETRERISMFRIMWGEDYFSGYSPHLSRMDLNLRSLSFLSFHWTELSSKVTIKVEGEVIKFLNKLLITFLYMFRLKGSLFPRMPLKGALACLSRPSVSSEGWGLYPSHRLSAITSIMTSVINIVSFADTILQVISSEGSAEKSDFTWLRWDSPVSVLTSLLYNKSRLARPHDQHPHLQPPHPHHGIENKQRETTWRWVGIRKSG